MKQLDSAEFIQQQTIKRLEASFCRVWPFFYSGAYGYTLCNPHFNERGDFTLELESPLDCNGGLIVPQVDRPDVCLRVNDLGTSPRYFWTWLHQPRAPLETALMMTRAANLNLCSFLISSLTCQQNGCTKRPTKI